MFRNDLVKILDALIGVLESIKCFIQEEII